MKPASRDALARALDALGVTAAHRDARPLHARPEVALTPAPAEVPIGASKIGGAPDLPVDASWPVDRNARALSIVAQLDLASLPAVDDDLPREGALSFLYDTLRQPPGDSRGDGASLTVRWSVQKPLRRRDAPYPMPLPQGCRRCGAARASGACAPRRLPGPPTS